MPAPWPAIARSLAEAARRSLVQAWTDYYEASYEWAVIKAWRAASLALGMVDPLEESPLGYRLLQLRCPEAVEARVEAPVLDGLYWLARDPWLQLILGDQHAVQKPDALDAIEAAVKIIDAAKACTPEKPLPPKMPEPPDWAGHAIRIGPILVIVDDDLAEARAPERIRGAKGRLPPGYYPIILSSDEALAYTELPLAKTYAQTGEVEVVSDQTGLATILKRTAYQAR